MKLEKHFDFTFSRRFPNGDIGSVSFGTKQLLDVPSGATTEELAGTAKQLSKQVYSSTIASMSSAAKKDKAVKAVLDGIAGAVKSQRDEQEAEKDLDE